MDNHFKSKISNDKIQLMANIDLNGLFNLNYNFDLLKGVIEELLKNQQILQKRMDDMENTFDDKDKRIAELEKEVKILKENQIDKNVITEIKNDISEIKKHLQKHDEQIDDSKLFFIKINFYSIFKIKRYE
jgi:predicted nuclease with TOPRIM domain